MRSNSRVLLGLNIDHVATVRQARGGAEPDLIQAAKDGIRGGARGITVHLREDRRHIQDRDVFQLKKVISVPLNLEMAVHPEIVRIACRLKPEKACLVPERRQELTTEGGLDVLSQKNKIKQAVKQLQSKGIVVSLFIDPIKAQIQAAAETGTDYIELHTGTYANARGPKRKKELKRLRECAVFAYVLGIGVNAGHGLNYENVIPIAKLPYMEELNIGHSIVGRSIFVGIQSAVSEMCALLQKATS